METFSKKSHLVIFAGFLFLYSCVGLKGNKVCFKDNCFYVELAVTPQQRAQGLMFRRHLDYNRGMLFIFENEGRYSFWMKNTFIPLDIIWLNKDKEVVFIEENAQPCKENFLCPTIRPKAEAKYVLELNAGVVNDIGLEVGDRVSFYIE